MTNWRALVWCMYWLFWGWPAGAASWQAQGANIPVAQLFMQLGEEAGVDVLVSANLSSEVHIQWRHVTAYEALLQLCRLAQLQCIWPTASSVLVVSADTETGAKAEANVRAHILPLKYVSAKQMANTLQTEVGLLAGSQLVADEAGRQLVLWLPAGHIDAVKALVAALDKPVPQVQIEARIVIASRDAGARLRRGLQLNVSNVKAGLVNQASVGLQNLSQSADLAVGLVAPHIQLQLELAAMEASGQALTLAQPQVVMQHMAEGRIETGQEVPYVLAGEDGDVRQWKQAVLGLYVTPRVLAHGQVELNLSVVQDSVGELLANGELALNTHRLHTQVRMVFGQTLVLGGALYEQQLQSLMENPTWMAMPLMRRWWYARQQQSQSFELLVFVTPRKIVLPVDLP